MSTFLLLTVIFWCLTTYFSPKNCYISWFLPDLPWTAPCSHLRAVSWAYILRACMPASSLSRVFSVREAWLPGSSVHGILQARILEWVDMISCRGSSQSRDQISSSCIASWFFTAGPLRKPLWTLYALQVTLILNFQVVPFFSWQ